MKRFILFSILCASSLATAAIEKFKAGEGSEASFEAVGRPAMLNIKGEKAKVQGVLQIQDQIANGKFELRLDQFDTGMELRNRHMKEKYLETAKFPTATLEINNLKLPKDFAPGGQLSSFPFAGVLTLKGVTKPVTGTLDVKGPDMTTTAEFKISLKDYPVGVPSYLGVTVADQVTVRARLPKMVRE